MSKIPDTIELSALTSSDRWPEEPAEQRPDQQRLSSTSHPYYGYNMESEPLASTFTDVTLPWRPFYLRRSVLATFTLVFLLVLVAIEALAAVSNKNNGIVSASSEQHYLWTFGPTAFLTLVAALWNRVDYQSKLVAPWMRLSRNPVHPSRTLLLDYLSGLQFLVTFKALRNKDFAPAATAFVALLIKVLIVASTGLLTLSWTAVNYGSHPMVLQDRFVDDSTGLNGTGTIPFYVMAGLIAQNLTYPDGISKDYAFQSVLSNLPANAEVSVTVDGFQASLDCQPVDLVMTGAAPPDPRDATTRMNLTLTSTGCDVKHVQLIPPSAGTCHSSNWTEADGDLCAPLSFARFNLVQCDGTTDDAGKRMLVLYGNYTTYVDYTTNVTDYTGHKTHPFFGRLHRSTQMLCIPNHAMVKLDVVRNGTEIRSLALSPATPNGTLSSVSPWNIMSALNESYGSENVFENNFSYGYPSIMISETQVDVDPYMQTALLSQLAPDTQAALLYDPNFLQQVVTGYYRQYAAIIAKQYLMEPVSIAVVGSALMDENRLVVRNWAAQLMAGMVAACLIFTCVLIFHVPTQGILPCSPGTISGLASLILHSQDLTAKLRGLGAADEMVLSHVLQTSEFSSGVVHDVARNQTHFGIVDNRVGPDAKPEDLSQVRSKQRQPSLLHPVSRLVLCLVLLALIVALEITLHKSTTEEGLGDVGDDTYIHYTWTTIPALVFGILAMIFASMDFRIRALAPYTTLKHTVSPEVFMTLDFLDMSIPRTLIKEIQLANYGACAATSVLLIASLFTIFTSSLFQALSIPTTGLVVLHANQSFPLSPSLNPAYREEDSSNLLASLILSSNLSYPRFTYDNLAFPELVPTAPLLATPKYNTSVLSVKTVVPAIRGRMDCRVYDSSKIRTNHTRNYTIGDSLHYFQNPLGIIIEGEECQVVEDDEEDKYNNLFNTYSNTTYFAVGDGTDSFSTNQVRGCSNLLYTWGQIDYNANPAIQHIASMGCNVSYELVDVDITFIGTALDIDSQNPPTPREDTVRTTTMITPKGQDLIYYDLAKIGTGVQLLDSFFAMLTSSQWAIPVSDLGNPSADDAIREAIKHQHGIILAQYLAKDRVPANTTNTTLTNPHPGDNDAQPFYNATTTDPTGRRRVVQDAVSTRILEALLGTTLLLLILGWMFMRDTAVLASSPTTIAAVASLIAGGNLLDLLPPNSEWMSAEEIAASFPPGTRFWLGWGRVPDKDGQNENGWSQFGIFAVGAGDDTGRSWNKGGRDKSQEYVKVGDGEDDEGNGELVTPRAPLVAALIQRVRGYRQSG